MESGQTGRALGDYFRILGDGWKTIALATVLGALVGVIGVLVVPKQYVATSAVAVSPTSADAGAVFGGRTTGQINLDTEAQIIKSAEVLSLVVEELDLQQEPLSLAGSVEVTVPANTSILRISYADEDPESAQQRSVAIAEAYLENRNTVGATVGKVQADGLKASLAQIDDEIADTKDAKARSRLLEARAQLIGQVALIESETSTPGRVITRATLPAQPETPRPAVILISTAALGFLVGVAIVFVRDRRRASSTEEATSGAQDSGASQTP